MVDFLDLERVIICLTLVKFWGIIYLNSEGWVLGLIDFYFIPILNRSLVH